MASFITRLTALLICAGALSGCQEQHVVVLNAADSRATSQSMATNMSGSPANGINSARHDIGTQCMPLKQFNLSAPPPFVLQEHGTMPALAIQEHVTGCAGVKFHIDATGHVRDAKVITEYPAGYGFGEELLTSLRASQFQPIADQSKWYYRSRNYVW